MIADQIREAVAEHAQLSVDIMTLCDDDDLYQAGLTSHASVNLMLGLEDTFDVEFPERFLRRATFESIDAMREAIEELTGERAASG